MENTRNETSVSNKRILIISLFSFQQCRLFSLDLNMIGPKQINEDC